MVRLVPLSWDVCVEAVGGVRTRGGVRAVQVHREATGTRQLLEAVGAALKSKSGARASASFGQGWVGDEALAVGLHAAATAASFSEAIEVATNHDGDSDSTASIAGQLFGAKHGLGALPAEAVYRLDVLGPLLKVFAEFENVGRTVAR